MQEMKRAAARDVDTSWWAPSGAGVGVCRVLKSDRNRVQECFKGLGLHVRVVPGVNVWKVVSQLVGDQGYLMRRGEVFGASSLFELDPEHSVFQQARHPLTQNP